MGSADRLTIDGAGKVGLGVNSSQTPDAAFEVRGSLNENSHAIRITNLGHGANTAATLEFASDDNSGSSKFVLGSVRGTLVSSSARTGALEFKTANAGNESTQMYISPTGDIGIGNTSPSLLDVSGALKAKFCRVNGYANGEYNRRWKYGFEWHFNSRRS